MMKVTIEFASLFELWNFNQLLSSKARRVSFFKRLVTCECTESEIELAIQAFHAKVVVLK